MRIALLGVVVFSACSEPVPKTVARADEACFAAGPFTMGHGRLEAVFDLSSQYNPAPTNDWVPAHEVELSEFCIDKYEVTWRQYNECIEAGICTTNGIFVWYTSRDHLVDPEYANRAIFGPWYAEAETYCLWRGKRLPTEAEWERAARGRDGRDYPWGNAPPSKDLLAPGLPLVPVGNFPQDQTPEGVFDLFGGESEWVADWYSPFAYGHGERQVDPQGPPQAVYLDGTFTEWGNTAGVADGERVIRGKKWNLAGGRTWPANTGVPVWMRSVKHPETNGSGFRCARSADGRLDTQVSSYRNLRFHRTGRVSP
ncbi:MAG: SUMF1/EgtB/PvdO family nonheme iron enzyme [Myxococcaceae bacterium]